MKTALFLFVISFFALNANAQVADTAKNKIAGQHLINAKNNFKMGMACQAGGVALGAAAAFLPLKEGQEMERLGLGVLGGGAFIFGAYYIFQAWNEIGSAGGELMANNEKLIFNFGIQQNGIGIAYNF